MPLNTASSAAPAPDAGQHASAKLVRTAVARTTAASAPGRRPKPGGSALQKLNVSAGRAGKPSGLHHRLDLSDLSRRAGNVESREQLEHCGQWIMPRDDYPLDQEEWLDRVSLWIERCRRCLCLRRFWRRMRRT